MGFYTDRTARNIGIISLADQNKLRKSVVAIAGMGAEGSRVFEVLIRMGVRFFRIADPGKVDVPDLNRQIYGIRDLGVKKVTAAYDISRTITGDLEIVTFNEGLNSENVSSFLEGVHVVVDAIDIDQPEVSILLNEHCRKNGLVTFVGVSIAFGCAIFVFTPTGMSMRDFLSKGGPFNWVPKLPNYVDQEILASVLRGERPAPVVCPAVSLMAGTLSTEIIRYICKKGEVTFLPKYKRIDLFDGVFEILELADGGRNE